MSSPLRSYSKPLALTHKHAEVLRNHGPHLVYQEKVDGSQFSFGIVDGVLRFRSRNVEIETGNAGMFALGVEAVQAVEGKLRPGWTYRGEYLAKPKHNTCAYERVPAGHVVLFDVDRGHCDYMEPQQVAGAAAILGFEPCPWWRHDGPFDPAWLERGSILGGPCIEGVVIKDYARIGADGKVLMAKVVREDFKEVHGREWKKKHPGRGDIIEELTESFRTEARWRKAVQHASEAGTLLSAPQDIGPLLKEIQQDIEGDSLDEMKDALWLAFRKQIMRGCVRGFPQWYKDQLAAQS